MKDYIETFTNSLPYERCYILSSSSPQVRFNGSSGGVVTELVRFLFAEKKIAGALSFRFMGKDLFVPYIAESAEEYLQSGSIYHEIPLLDFLRNHITSVKSPLFVTCLPCQCAAVRQFLKKHNIESVIVSLVCSGQLTKQATYDFLEKHRIDINKIRSFRYRGKGWPSGMHIETEDGTKYFFHNTESDWKCFFHSAIYNLNRCFRCTDTYGISADFSMADPWFRDFIETEKIGCTVVCVSEKRWIDIIETMREKHHVELHKQIDLAEFVESQYWTVAKKKSFGEFLLLKWLIRIFRTNIYRRLFLTGNFRYLHYKLYMKRLRKYKRKLNAQSCHNQSAAS